MADRTPKTRRGQIVNGSGTSIANSVHWCEASSQSYNYGMAKGKKENGRSKRRQPRKGFPHRIVAYLDAKSKRLVDAALKVAGENTSMFTATALVERAERVLSEHGKK